MINRIRLLSVLVATILTTAVIGQNSNDARPVTQTYFVKNAIVVQQPGTTLPSTSIVIKDGLITGMGSGIPAPYDAKVIDADSMYVYAAWIDAAGHAGLPKADEGDRPKVKNPGKPPNDVAGITPQHKAADLIKYDDKSIKEMREAGYGYAHVLPRGRMLPGVGAIITTGDGGREHMLLQDQTGMYSQLRSARGVFPNTVIGVMSKYRDLYKNAQLAASYESTYSKRPTGLQRPSASKELAALGPVVSNGMPVYFRAEKVRDILKVLTLQEELGFDLVLTDARQADKVLPQLKSKNIPILLSLELPKEIKDDEKKGKNKSDNSKNGGDNTEIAKSKKEAEKDTSDPLKAAFDKRKMEAYAAYESQAAEVAKAGVPFAFSTISTKPKETAANIQRMMKRGLTADQALAALTTTAAKLTGLSNVAGTVEKGKLGNLIICDKPYFDEKSKIKYMLVDGKVYEYEEKKKKKSDGSDTGDLSGTWSYVLEIPGQESAGTMVIEKDGDSYLVKLDSSEEPGDFEDAFDVDMDGSTLSFGLNVDDSGMTLNITSEMTFEGDEFTGTMSITQFGAFPVTGSKTSQPK